MATLRPILAKVYGAGEVVRWTARWRGFFLACSELFRSPCPRGARILIACVCVSVLTLCVSAWCMCPRDVWVSLPTVVASLICMCR